MITGTVNNGGRIPLSLDDFSGLAGFVHRGHDEAQLAFTPNVRTDMATAVGDTLTLWGSDWRVSLRESSPYVDNMTLLTIHRVGPATIA